MKKIIFSFAALLIMYAVSAQNSGTVSYKETRKLHFNIQGNAPPPANLPTENSNNTVLYFNTDASLYKNDSIQPDNGQNMTSDDDQDGDHIRIMMDVPDNRVYCDLANKTMTKKQDFMQRTFLIETDVNSSGWKLTGDQKMILGYPCQEAVMQDSTQKVIAWFTSAIPVTTGPSSYVGLPGLVLEININDGDQTIVATAIKNTVDASQIQKPKDGKKVTDEEYKKIVADKMKEMGVDNPGGANVIIRVNDSNH